MSDELHATRPTDWLETLLEARAGSDDALGQLLDDVRPYLLTIAAAELDDGLRTKVGASDVVQESLMEAYRDFERFAGDRPEDLRAWLRQVLLHNVWNFRRHYRGTEKRNTDREVEFPTAGPDARFGETIAGDQPSPSVCAAALEEAARLERAIAKLPETYRQVIVWRNLEGHPFAWIGQQLERTEDATRLIWYRAVGQLRKELASE